VALEPFFEAPNFDEASAGDKHLAPKVAQSPLALLHQRSVICSLSRNIVDFLLTNQFGSS